MTSHNPYESGFVMNIHFIANQAGVPYRRHWKKTIAAGRAAEGLRAQWQKQLLEVQKEIGFEYIRFHGLLNDEMMIYHEREDGTPYFNWQYFDELFDFCLGAGLHPIVELSFMPAALASGKQTVFWWKGNITPPKDYAKWSELLRALVCHSVNRYGLAEVLQWYFEVWNEPDLNIFWSSSQEEYDKLYRYSASAVKSVDSRLKIGGPASSGADCESGLPYLRSFLDFCSENHLPVDFVSVHPYPTNCPVDAKGNRTMGYGKEDATCGFLKTLRETIDGSAFPNAEIHLTEWNSSPSSRDLIHDTAFMAPFVIENNLKCIGLCDSLAFWTFTDIFEENAAGDSIFHGGFGLMNYQGLKKASYYGYRFLSKLGNLKLGQGKHYFIARKGDTIQVLIWNYCHYRDDFANGNRGALSEYSRYGVFKDKDLQVSLLIDGLDGNYKVTVETYGRKNGSSFDAWIQMGALENPTAEEIDYLKAKSVPDIAVYNSINLKSYGKNLILKTHDVLLLEITKQA